MRSNRPNEWEEGILLRARKDTWPEGLRMTILPATLGIASFVLIAWAVDAWGWARDSLDLSEAYVGLALAVGGSVFGNGVIFGVHLFRAPFIQRDEARAAVIEFKRGSDAARRIVSKLLKADQVTCYEWQQPLSEFVSSIADELVSGLTCGQLTQIIAHRAPIPYDPFKVHACGVAPETVALRAAAQFFCTGLTTAQPSKPSDILKLTEEGEEALLLLRQPAPGGSPTTPPGEGGDD